MIGVGVRWEAVLRLACRGTATRGLGDRGEAQGRVGALRLAAAATATPRTRDLLLGIPRLETSLRVSKSTLLVKATLLKPPEKDSNGDDEDADDDDGY